MPTDKLSLRKLAEIHHVDYSLLGRWQREDGLDVSDSRAIAERVLLSQNTVKSWKQAKNRIYQSSDGESHEHWKREKTKEEVERLRLANARAAGEVFDKIDGERVQDAWASALQLALAERKATAPQQLAGMDEAGIFAWMEKEDRKLQDELSDLESGLWQQVMAKYAGEGEEIARTGSSTG
ncbi:MAG: hypothetical protein ACSHX9_02165 [Luteolibacter sp.]